MRLNTSRLLAAVTVAALSFARWQAGRTRHRQHPAMLSSTRSRRPRWSAGSELQHWGEPDRQGRGVAETRRRPRRDRDCMGARERRAQTATATTLSDTARPPSRAGP